MKGTLHEDQNTFFYHISLLLQRETFRTKVVKSKHILCSITSIFFRKSYSLWEKVENYSRAGQTTDDNMAHAHCLLDT
jgi:hypothetical protein